MRILVFEFMVGGGVADQHPLSDELQTFYQQGHSMLKAVCEDLLLLEHEVVTLVDINANVSLPSEVVRISAERQADLDPTLLAAAIDADRILLIAPETDGCLEHFANLLSSFANRFIGPNIGYIQLTADKFKCHRWCSQRGVPCPETFLLRESDDLPENFLPCVAKPVDGAGSENVRLISSAAELNDFSAPVLIQKYVAGIAVSVSVIVESSEMVHFLEPGQQVFDAEPFGVHLRTEFPLEPDLRERALKLARLVVDASPNVVGYFGIDMVLTEDVADDVVIEINPRLTTSYYFLREWSKENLAEKFPL